MALHTLEPTLFTNYTEAFDGDYVLYSESQWNIYGYIILITALAFIQIVGMTGNASILYVFFTDKSIRSPTNLFIFSIAFSDLCMIVSSIPLALASAIARKWLFGYLMCRMYGFGVLCLGLVSLLSHGAIALDRYFVITKPKLGIQINYKVATAVILTTWFWAFMWAFFPLIGWSGYTYEGLGTWCSVRWSSQTGDTRNMAYVICLFIFTYGLTLFCMIFCYTSIYFTINDISRRINVYTNDERKKHKTDQKVLRVMVLIGAAFFAAWTPYGIVSLWATFGDSTQIPMALITSCSMCGKASAAINPMIYTATNRAFRRSIEKLWMKVRRKSTSENNTNDIILYPQTTKSRRDTNVDILLQDKIDTKVQLGKIRNVSDDDSGTGMSCGC